MRNSTGAIVGRSRSSRRRVDGRHLCEVGGIPDTANQPKDPDQPLMGGEDLLPTEPLPADATSRTGASPDRYRTSVEDAMRATGTTSPSQAKKKLEEQRGQRLVYMPHVGAKQRARAEARRIAMLKKSVGL